jgi:alkylhydroperoxidase family enzyme
MAYIKLITESEADGKLAGIYEAARKRAGRVFNILRIQSQNADTLQAMLELYAAAVKGLSPLTRAQREMLAVVTSRANECHY